MGSGPGEGDWHLQPVSVLLPSKSLWSGAQEVALTKAHESRHDNGAMARWAFEFDDRPKPRRKRCAGCSAGKIISFRP